MSKLALVLLGTSSVALGSTTAYLVHELHVERENTQTLRAEVGKLEQRIASTQQSARVEPPVSPAQAIAPPAAAAAHPATPVAAASVAVSSNAPTPLTREDTLRLARESMERQRALMRNPEYREALLLQQKAMLPRQYPQLQQALGIGADQYEQLLNTLANQSMRSMDNQNAANDGSTDPERMRSKWQQMAHQNEAELRAALGDRYQAWKDYQSNMMAYQQVEQLRSTLATSGLPLDQDQAQALVKPIAAEQQNMAQEFAKQEAQRTRDTSRNDNQNGIRPVVFSVEQQELQLKRSAELNQRIRDAAVGILSSDQLHQLEVAQNQQVQLQEASIRMMRAQVEASERGEMNIVTTDGTQVQYVLGQSTVTVPATPRRTSTSSH